MLTILYVIGAILTFMFAVGYLAYDGECETSNEIMLAGLMAALSATIWPLTAAVWIPLGIGKWFRNRTATRRGF